MGVDHSRGRYVLRWLRQSEAQLTLLERAEQIEWVADSLRDAIYYAPPGFLELAVSAEIDPFQLELTLAACRST